MPKGGFMDLIRFTAMLPVRAARQDYGFLADVLPKIFGRMAWTPPTWVYATSAELRRRPREYAGGAVSAVVLVAALYGGWVWYKHLPHPPEPPRIAFEVEKPQITDYYDDAGPKTTIHPLTVKFDGSVAPLALVGKTW